LIEQIKLANVSEILARAKIKRQERQTIGPVYDPACGECKSDHDPVYLQQEIAAQRWVHEYRKRQGGGEYVLVCLRCDGLWDHRATDRLIESICR
jgi:hypothetical protein